MKLIFYIARNKTSAERDACRHEKHRIRQSEFERVSGKRAQRVNPIKNISNDTEEITTSNDFGSESPREVKV